MSNIYPALATNNLPATTTTTTLADSPPSTNSLKYHSTDSTRELKSKSRSSVGCCSPIDYHRPNIGDDNVQLFGSAESLNEAASCDRYVRRGRPRTPPEPSPSSIGSCRSESFDPYRSRHSSTGSQSSDNECRKQRRLRHSERLKNRRVLPRARSPPSPPVPKKPAVYAKSSSKSIKRKTPEKIPYFVDQKREKDRLKRIYGTTSPSPERRRTRTKSPRAISKSSRSRHYKVPPSTPPLPSSPVLPASPVLRRSRRRERDLAPSPVRAISPAPRHHRVILTEPHSHHPRSPSPYVVRIRSRSRERPRSTSYEKMRVLKQDWHHSSRIRESSSSTAPATQIITIPVPVPDYSYAYPPWSPQSPSWNSPMSASSASSRYAPYPPPYPMHQMVPPGVLPPPLRPPPAYGSGMVPIHHTRSVRLQRYGNPDYAPRMHRGSYNYRPRSTYTPN